MKLLVRRTIIYEAQYGERIHFARAISSWVENVETEDGPTPQKYLVGNIRTGVEFIAIHRIVALRAALMRAMLVNVK